MTFKEYKELIEYRVNFINKKLGTNYYADYCSIYGGWNLNIIDVRHQRYTGILGFELRKSSAEMLSYISGIYELLCHYDVEQK